MFSPRRIVGTGAAILLLLADGFRVWLWAGPPAATTQAPPPDEAKTKPNYKPRRPIGSSGYQLTLAIAPTWQPNASPTRSRPHGRTSPKS